MQAATPTSAAARESTAPPAGDGEDRPMKAMTHEQYGPLEQLRVRDVPKPSANHDEVLVRVHAAGLHIGDCFGVRGTPLLMRVETGIRKPKLGIPGFDLAGTVESVGAKVTRFKPGDSVFGTSAGTCAQFATAREDALALKPTNLSFEEAAAIPTSGLAALHAMRDVAKLSRGQTVLINGASGGVGHFAIQIAKSFAAEVTGVCSEKNGDMIRSLGVDHVVDYAEDDFTRNGRQYDVVFDNVENRSLSECRRAVTRNGMLILNSGTGASGLRLILRILKPLMISPFVRQKLRRFLSTPNHRDLLILKDLAESGKLSPFVSKVWQLHEVPEALRLIESGHARGKTVVKL